MLRVPLVTILAREIRLKVLPTTAGNVRQEFNFVAFVKAIFDQIKFLTKLFYKARVLAQKYS